MADVHTVLAKMARFADSVRSGAWTGHTGERIRTVVNIGIGGSDLGPVMAYEALRAYSDRALTFRFVSNIDPTDVTEAVLDLDPATTLFIVSSKTFTTQETLTNARAARQWLVEGLEGDESAVAKHFVAVSTNAAEVRKFGIDEANMFGFWDWVGGRYSLDSAIGLSLMVAIGPDGFGEFLGGMHAMDTHFRTRAARGEPAGDRRAAQRLVLELLRRRDPRGAALQPVPAPPAGLPAAADDGEQRQVGKRGRHAGHHDDGRDLLGRAGHERPARLLPAAAPGHAARAGRLHRVRPAEPRAAGGRRPGGGGSDMHDLFMANLFAQSAALAFGKTAEEIAAEGTPAEVVPHKVMPGNRPSTTILARKLTPSTLGQLIAFYEHVTFVEGVIWGIDSFDQWGVELGKVMARQFGPALTRARPRHVGAGRLDRGAGEPVPGVAGALTGADTREGVSVTMLERRGRPHQGAPGGTGLGRRRRDVGMSATV